ncbi:MAG: GumC family protein [Deltaproteobacteria bacterium]|jgi:uncharacterized protein involved in exopolysaccharide biosynthesis|nr:GumC family protein [Deltaproteobacteria bacterium]
MQDQSLTPLQIRIAFHIIKKHKWKILTLFFSTVITVAVCSFFSTATPIYQASSRLLVKPGREDVYVSPAGGSPAVIGRSTQGEKINTEIAILRSSALVVELVDRFGVNRLFEYHDRIPKGKPFKKIKKPKIPPIEEVHRSVRERLEISRVPKSNVINVTFGWPDPVISAEVVNKLVDLYLVQHLKVHTNFLTYNLLEEQTKKKEGKLREAEKELGDFKRLHSITSLAQQKTILLGRLSEAESQRKRTESEIEETLELVTSFEAQLSNFDKNAQLHKTVNKNSATLAALKTKLVDLELQGLKEEISRLKKMIAEEEQKVIVSGENPMRQNLEIELINTKARLRGLKATIENQKLRTASSQEELKVLDGFENRMNKLERQVSINEANYKLYLTKFEEAKISESMDKQMIGNVRVIEPAVPVMKPVGVRNKLQVLIRGCFLGLFAGIGMAFFIEFIHPVFRTREDVEQFLGLPVLAALPKEK